MSDILIESRQAGYTYRNSDTAAFTEVSFGIRPGECVLLCGQSGCGKTTFTRLLNGLAPAFFPGKLTGRCRVGDLFAGQAALESYVPLVGSVFQNPKTQFFNIDTTAELAFPCENSGWPAPQIRRRIEEVVKQFGLQKLMDRSVFQLSGGEKQRIAFAAACMLSPRVLVLDEPTSNLDAEAIVQLHDMIAAMKQAGITIVLAEHRLAWITDLIDRYLYFNDGRLAAQWTADEFKALPAEALTAYGLRARDLTACRQELTEKISLQTSGEAVLAVKSLTLGYHKNKPLASLPDFSLGRGKIVGLMGHNGIGKSTLAKTLCGLQEPLSGQILWQGHPLTARQRLRNSFLVMQDVNYQLFSESVQEEVQLGAAHPEKTQEILQALGLAELAQRHPMSLSGGQKQRVVVAAAMLSGKPFLVLDEPTSGLDHCHMQQVGRLLQQLRDSGKTVLVITHDEELAAGWCDRIISWQEP